MHVRLRTESDTLTRTRHRSWCYLHEVEAVADYDLNPVTPGAVTHPEKLTAQRQHASVNLNTDDVKRRLVY